MTSPTPNNDVTKIDTADIGLSLLALSQTTGPEIVNQLDVLIGERTVDNLQNHLVVAVGMIRQLAVHAAEANGIKAEQFVDRYRQELLKIQSGRTGGAA